jgi:DNA-binding transcriptional MerR regulator
MNVSITVVSELTGLTQRAIRYYEQRGLIRPTRDHGNRRAFDQDARRKLFLIALLRRAGLSVEDVVQVLALEAAGADAQKELAVGKLRAAAARLDELGSHVRTALHLFEATDTDAVGARS